MIQVVKPKIGDRIYDGACVLAQYVKQGMGELDQEKLGRLLELK